MVGKVKVECVDILVDVKVVGLYEEFFLLCLVDFVVVLNF